MIETDPAIEANFHKVLEDHTAGDPPSRGSTILVNSGCTENNSNALTKIADV